MLLTKGQLSHVLIQSPHNPVLLTKKTNNRGVGAVVAHVDETFAGGEILFLDKFRATLPKRFNVSKLGQLDTYISFDVERDDVGAVFFSMEHHILQISKQQLAPG